MTDDARELALAKAATLVEALPWLERFAGAMVVIKYGGHAMVDAQLKAAFAHPTDSGDPAAYALKK
jgi:acetylglutamate kinase